jgi:hypothetical protein
MKQTHVVKGGLTGPSGTRVHAISVEAVFAEFKVKRGEVGVHQVTDRLTDCLV